MKNKLVTLTLASLPLLGCSGYTTFTAEKPVSIVGEAPVEQKQCAKVVLKNGKYFIDLGGRDDIYSVNDDGEKCYFNYRVDNRNLWITDYGCNNVVDSLALDDFYDYEKSFDRDFLKQEGYTALFDNLASKAQSFVCEEYRQLTTAELELLWKKKELKDIVDKLE